jgi:hypothetical protein
MASLLDSYTGATVDGLAGFLLAHVALVAGAFLVVHVARRRTRPAIAATVGLVVAALGTTALALGDGGCSVLHSYSAPGSCSSLLAGWSWVGTTANTAGPLPLAELATGSWRTLQALVAVGPAALGLAALGPRPPRRVASTAGAPART